MKQFAPRVAKSGSRRLAALGLTALAALGASIALVERSYSAPTQAAEEWILFSGLDGDGDYELFVVRRDGTGLSALTRNDVDDIEPVVSADGRTIAFLGRSLRVAASDGSAVRRIAPETHSYALSADGKRIAFVRSSSSFRDSLWVGSSVTGKSRRVLTLEGIYSLAWSPNGDWIAYDRLSRRSRDLALTRPDGTDRRLFGSSDHTSTPYWSPDGRWIAYVRDEALLVYEVKTGKTRRLTRAFGSPLAWSPDGRFLAFGRERVLLTIGVRGGRPRMIAPRRPNGATRGLAWSRDGESIAFQSSGAQACTEFFVVPAAGGPVHKLPGKAEDCDVLPYEETWLAGWVTR